MSQLALFRGPQARAVDPMTCHVAAATVTPKASEMEADILRCFMEHGPLTDDEMCTRLEPIVLRWGTWKSARSRLTKRGSLVWTGESRPSLRDCPQRVWRDA